MKKRPIALIAVMLAGGYICASAQNAASDSTKVDLTPNSKSAELTSDTIPTTGAMVLSLDECLAIALSDNPTVRVADMDIDRVDYSRWETVAQLLPQITFSGSYNRMIAKQVTYMNMDFDKILGSLGGSTDDTTTDGSTEASKSRASSSDKKDNGIKVGLDNSYQVGFSASVPIIAPQLWASLKLSDTQILESVEKARASRIDLINSVKSAYYTLMLANDSKKVLQQSYDMAALTHDIYTKQFQLGVASDYDVLRTSVAMKNIEPSLMQADVAIRQARLQLLILMGLDNTVDFSITGSLNDYEKTMYEDVLSINPDYSSNSSLVLNDIQTKQLDQLLKVEKASLYPTLAASASYNWTSSTNGTPLSFRWNPYSVAGLSLSVPLFTGGKRYARIKEAEIQIEEMKYNRANLERSIAMQVDLAMENIQVNVKQIASCSESMAQATRAHDIMQKSFAIGAASYLNLRDSELALTQSQLAYYQAIYNYMVARSELERLLGTEAPFTEHTPVK